MLATGKTVEVQNRAHLWKIDFESHYIVGIFNSEENV